MRQVKQTAMTGGLATREKACRSGIGRLAATVLLLLGASQSLAATTTGYGMSISADPVAAGEGVTLGWNNPYGGSATCNISKVDGFTSTPVLNDAPNPGNTTLTLNDPGTYTYQGQCGSNGYAYGTVTFTVVRGIVSFTGSASTVFLGDSVDLSWKTSSQVQSCTINGDSVGTNSSGQSFAPTTAGSITYTLNCEEADGTAYTKTVNVSVKEIKPVTIDYFDFGAAKGAGPITSDPGLLFGVRWKALDAERGCTMTRTGTDGSSFQRSTAVSASLQENNANVAVTTAAGLAPGNTVTWTLRCIGYQNDVVEQSITANINPIPLPTINKFAVKDAGWLFSTQSSVLTWYPLDIDIDNAWPQHDCKIRVTEDSPAPYAGYGSRKEVDGYKDTNYKITSFNIGVGTGSSNSGWIRATGDYTFVLTCNEGTPNEQSRSASVKVVSQVELGALTATPTSIAFGGTTKLEWFRYSYDYGNGNYYNYGEGAFNATEGCTINGEAVPADALESGSLTTPPLEAPGALPFSLTCTGDTLGGQIANSATKTVTVNVADVDLQGQYFGKVNLIANEADDSTATNNAGARTDDTGRYGILAYNTLPAWWLWDFGNNTVRVSMGRLYADNGAAVELRLLAPALTSLPTSPSLNDATGTIENLGLGIFRVKFSAQLNQGSTQGPLAHIDTLVKVRKDSDGKLIITTEDQAPDGVDWFADLGDDAPSSTDGIPGVLLPAMGESGISNPNALFTRRLSPAFLSDGANKLTQVDATACDGVPLAFYRDVLRLNACPTGVNAAGKIDSDGDGVADADEIGDNWVAPLDTAGRGVIDALRPAALDDNPHFAGLIALGNGERVLLNASSLDLSGAAWAPLSGDWLGGKQGVYQFTADSGQQLPEKNASDVAYQYGLGTLLIPSSGNGEVTLYFANGIPQGLTLFKLNNSTKNTASGFERTATYSTVAFQPVEGTTNSIRFAHAGSGLPTQYALAHTDSSRAVAEFNPLATEYTNLLSAASALAGSLTPDVSSLLQGGIVTLSWEAQNTDSCRVLLNGAEVGQGGATGSVGHAPTLAGANTYVLHCLDGDANEQEVASATVTVTSVAPASGSLTASASSITKGNHVTLTWTSQDTAACRVMLDTTEIASGTSGSQEHTPTTAGTNRYALVCAEADSSEHEVASATVTVTTASGKKSSSGGSLTPGMLLLLLAGAAWRRRRLA